MTSLRVTVDGRPWHLPFAGITAMDVADFNRTIRRVTFRRALNDPRTHDLDVVAGFLWLAIRRESPTTFEEVAQAITLDSLIVIERVEE